MTANRAARCVLLFLLASCSWASPLAPGMKAVEEIRGRKFLHEVRNVTIDRADLAKHLEAQMKRSTPYSLDDWSRVLRALQLVDGGTQQLLPQLLDLYESQVLAFYDAETHTYYSIRQLPELPAGASQLADPKTLEEAVMVHELTHALQDQHFSLDAKEQALMRDTDANLAYHAVLEGEAVLVMVANMLKKNNVDLAEVAKDDSMLGALSSAANADSMIDPKTPRYFAELLKFPYLQGLEFVLAAYRRGGWKAVDELHSNPPRSTREVLHPDEYFARASGSKEEAFDATKPKGAIAVEHLGEFHWRFLLGPEAVKGLAGDRAVVYENGRVELATQWDREEQSAAFALALQGFLTKRGLEPRVTRDGRNVRAEYVTK
jgi:hypothetical protein